MKTKELRKELIEFLEANNYFISILETKKNAIGIVDSYLKNYKGLNDLQLLITSTPNYAIN
jgi:hypothetical protein